jgi:competence protein ComEC
MNELAATPADSRGAHAPLIAVLAAVMAGIVLDRVVPLSIVAWWVAAVLAWLAWYASWRAGWTRASTLAILLSLLGAAAAWHHFRWSLYDRDEIGLSSPAESGPAAVEVVATSGARRIPAPPPNPLATLSTPERTRIDAAVLRIRDCADWQAVTGEVALLIDGQLRSIRPGDRLRVFGTLGPIASPSNPGEFDFAAHARTQRRLCTLRAEFPDCVTKTAHGPVVSVRAMVDALRSSGESLLWHTLQPRQSRLAAAMFLGSREELEPDETQAFMETGTIHLLVISGLNVGILAGSLLLLLRIALVPRSWSLAIVCVACVLYAITTDAQPPVVRATVMVLIGCAAVALGRQALGYNTLAAAGLVVLALNPAELFQSGTQLSFLSVAVLVWLAQRTLHAPTVDPLDRLIASTRSWPDRALRRAMRVVGDWVVVSAMIWLVICPLVMARFHLASPVAVVLGPVLSVPVAMAMATGFGIFACGWLAPPVATVLGEACDWNLRLMESCVSVSQTWRGSHFWVPGPSEWWLAGFYGFLAFLVLGSRWTPPVRWRLGLLAAWIALGIAVSLGQQRDRDRLRCTFLSVGHGAAVVVELPGGQTLLYDAGRLGSPTMAARAVSGYLWSRGLTHLDAVVISHADADHYNAVPALIKQFSLGAVYVSPVMFLERAGSLEALRAALARSGVAVREVWSGDRLRVGGGATVEVLHPPRRGVLGSDNANSIVLAIEYQGRRLLLTGDLESPGLDDVIAEQPYDCDVVLAPHHGSPSSDPPGTGRLVCGKKEFPNHGHQTFMKTRGRWIALPQFLFDLDEPPKNNGDAHQNLRVNYEFFHRLVVVNFQPMSGKTGSRRLRQAGHT